MSCNSQSAQLKTLQASNNHSLVRSRARAHTHWSAFKSGARDNLERERIPCTCTLSALPRSSSTESGSTRTITERQQQQHLAFSQLVAMRGRSRALTHSSSWSIQGLRGKLSARRLTSSRDNKIVPTYASASETLVLCCYVVSYVS